MNTKFQQKKARERQLLNDEKFLHKSAEHAFKSCTLVALYSMVEVLDASNPKLMQTMITMYKTWEDIGAKKTNLRMLRQHILDTCNIDYDEETGQIVDNGKVKRAWNKK